MKKGRIRGEGKGPLGSGNLSDTTELARRQLPGGYKGVAHPRQYHLRTIALHFSPVFSSLSISPLRSRSDALEHRRRLNPRRMIVKLCLHATRGIPFIRALFANQFHVQRRVARKLCRRYASRRDSRAAGNRLAKVTYTVLHKSRAYGNIRVCWLMSS